MKITPLAILALASSSTLSFGAAGMFEELLWTSTNPSFSFTDPGTTFYEIDSDTSNLFGALEFQGANLGTYNVGDTLFLTGEQKSFKNNGTDVTAHTLSYSLNGVTFTDFSYNFEADLGGGDQRWGRANAGGLTGNILDGLTPGNYTLEVFSSITTNSVDSGPTVFNNNGGSNFSATFTVVPEPSTSALIGLSLVGLVARRRRA